MSLRFLLPVGMVLFGVLINPYQRADAQVVQQPVVNTFGVTTTVSVPDRGSILLGSVGRAATSRTTAGIGPWRSQSGIGLESAHTSVSAHVTIHDLRAMDEFLLNQAVMAPRDEARLNGHAAHAFEQLTGVRQEPLPGMAASGRPAHQTPSDSAGVSAAKESKAEKFLRLGRAAEADGKIGLAKLHYAAAARNGSSVATMRLAALAER